MNSTAEHLICLAYHKIDNRCDWGISRTTVAQFKQQMKILDEGLYQTATLSQALNSQGSHDKAKAVYCITFDDAYRSVYENAFSAMMEHGVSGTIFVISGFVGNQNTWDVNFGWRTFNHLSWNELRELQAAGFEIGSHTVSHKDLTLLDDKQLLIELKDSKKILEDNLGCSINYISYPFGAINQKVIDCAQKVGYKAGVTMGRGSRSIYSLQRRGVYLFDSLSSFKRKLHVRNHNFEDLKGKVISWFSQGTPLLRQVILSR